MKLYQVYWQKTGIKPLPFGLPVEGFKRALAFRNRALANVRENRCHVSSSTGFLVTRNCALCTSCPFDCKFVLKGVDRV